MSLRYIFQQFTGPEKQTKMRSDVPRDSLGEMLMKDEERREPSDCSADLTENSGGRCKARVTL